MVLDYTKLVVMGGIGAGVFLQDVEVINLADPDVACLPLNSYPYHIQQPTLAFTEGKLRSCGGAAIESGNTRECYEFDPDTNSWTRNGDLLEARHAPSSTVIRQNQWFIVGGIASAQSVGTEVRVGGASESGPSVRDQVLSPCLVTLNDTHIFLADWENGFTYILNWEEESWEIQVRNMRFRNEIFSFQEVQVCFSSY